MNKTLKNIPGNNGPSCGRDEIKNVKRHDFGTTAPKTLSEWVTGIYGQYLVFLFGLLSAFRTANIVFFDVEFFPLPGNRKPRPRLVVYHETHPPNGQRKRNIVWYDDHAAKERFISAIRRARYIVAYNPRAADFPALKRWGLREGEVLLHTIDLFEFIFKVISYPGTGSLSSVSQLNGGPAKVVRKDGSREEYQKQCQSDLKMLEFVFWKVVAGKFRCSKYGEIAPKTLKLGDTRSDKDDHPVIKGSELVDVLSNMWLDAHNIRFLLHGPTKMTLKEEVAS